MFERFTKPARNTVTSAQAEAARLGHRHIGTEHLLLALLGGTEPDLARETLETHGLTKASTEAQLLRITGTGDLDAEALRSVGVDLDEIRRRAEEAFGPGALNPKQPASAKGRWLRRNDRVSGGHIPFTDDAKLTLELALREAIALKHNYIGNEHLLLGLIRGATGLGLRMIEAQEIAPGDLRAALLQRLRQSA